MAVKINSQKTIHQGRVYDLVKENITLPNGVTIDVDVIRHPGAVAIVPMLEREQLVLIKQYRHALGRYIWEIPAGTIDGSETPLVCAHRELVEETGFSASRMQNIGEVTPIPGYSDERIHLFMAQGLKPVPQQLDADEILDVQTMALHDALAMIANNEIQDAKTIIGLFFASQWLNNQSKSTGSRSRGLSL